MGRRRLRIRWSRDGREWWPEPEADPEDWPLEVPRDRCQHCGARFEDPEPA